MRTQHFSGAQPFASSLLAIAVAAGAAFASTTSMAASLAEALKDIEAHPAAGPNGEKPVLASELKLTPQEIQKIKSMNATAAIVMHYTASDWAKAQMAGQKKALEEIGVKIIAVTDAGYRAEKQVSDIETVMARKPNIMITVPAEQSATADAYKRAAAAGIKIVFLDQAAAGMKPGQDYVSLVSSDNRGMGKAAALLLAQALGGKGNIGLIPHASDLFATKERLVGFKEAIKAYPDIKVVAEQGVGGPDFAGESERIASGMLTANPTLKGIWAVWDVPTEGVLAAARASGRGKELAITTCDLGVNIAIDMAKDGFVKGTGSQRPYGAGYAEGILAGYALVGKQAPPYVVLPALPVSKASLLEAWPQSNGTPPPKVVIDALGGAAK
jgi:ribose transport system substrate-binding protein